MTSVGVRQHTQDVCGCPCVSVCVRLCLSAHTGRLWLSISTHISTLVLGLSTLALPVDCSGDFGQRGLSVQYTQDVHGCPSAHTGRLCVSVSTHRTSVAVRVCPCVSVRTHRTSLGVHQTSVAVRVCPCMSVSTHRTSMAVCVWLCVSVSTHMTSEAVHHTHRTSVGVRKHTQDVCGCPSAHTGHPWLSVCVLVCLCVSVSTHRTFVAVHQYTYQHAGPWTQQAGPSRGQFG
ncbi:hypothetical protein YC2023_066306 [Brassica napus]